MATRPSTIWFVRHGMTPTTGSVLPGRAKGLHLSDAGVAQAEAVASRLAELGEIAAVYASPMERTQETAKPIARAVGRRVRTEKGLLECDFGKWTGQKLVHLRKLDEWTSVQRHPSGFRFPGGESFAEMQTRMVDTANRLAAKHPGESIVAVSHADPIKAILTHALGAHLDQFQRLVVSPCSASGVVFGSTGTTVLGVNLIDGLVGLVPS